MTQDPAALIAGVLRRDRGRLLAALIARFRDFDLAEEALQEALTSALQHWGRVGVPASPQGWLLTAASRRAIDRLRRGARARDHAAQTAPLLDEQAEDAPDIPDDRLRLIFTCCHPALDPKSRVALTLRSICGLTTPQIARAFLDAEPTMGQRLSRAKAKIAATRIPFSVPGPEDWADRLEAVLTVIYLIFNQGYTAPDQSDPGRDDLCAEAIFLARLVNDLRPGQAEVEGLLALLLITHARQAARIDTTGVAVPLDRQDRNLWSGAAIADGSALLDAAVARRAPGPFQVKAAIAALHVAEGPVDWPQIVLLYDSLLRMEPTPVIALNRAVALAEAGALEAALRALDALAGPLGAHQPLHAARAEYLARAGRTLESDAAYERAIALAQSEADATFLRNKRESQRNFPASPE